ncbi:hypothetical protein EDL98_07300 [Ornithobacterium rhinotracheale]|nr:hypothetical protein [Ornithobacterium rhinotracheale]
MIFYLLKQIKSKKMKKIYLVLFIVIQCAVKAQVENLSINIFDGKSFQTDQIIGYEKLSPQLIRLSKLDSEYPYGNITTFFKNNFISGNEGSCGNECRITVYGKYTLKKNKIKLFINKIEYWKDCKAPDKIINKTIGTYTWEEQVNGDVLMKKIKK